MYGSEPVICIETIGTNSGYVMEGSVVAMISDIHDFRNFFPENMRGK
jgi:hypothetical protein